MRNQMIFAQGQKGETMTEETKQKLIEMCAAGYTDEEIADELHYSESHIKNTRKIMGIRKGRKREDHTRK